MENPTIFDILSPWILMFGILFAVGYAEDWIHRHFFGIGYLVTEDKMSATRVFYAFFLPGIFIHEFIQYLVAGAINVPIKKVVAWPDQQENGVMRLDFIVVDHEKSDRFRPAIVAAAPFAVMGVLVWYISTHILDLHILTDSLGSGDLQVIWSSFVDLVKTPDFVLWIYLLFVIANSMVPNKADARGLPLILGGIAILLVALTIIGMGDVLLDTLTTDVADTLSLVSTALIAILVMDIGAIFILGFIEDLLERWRGYKMDYSRGENLTMDATTKKPRREAGSDLPLEAGDMMPSIYNRVMPLPDSSARPKGRQPAAPTTPAIAPSATPTSATGGVRVRETSPVGAEASGDTATSPTSSQRTSPALASRTNPSFNRPQTDSPDDTSGDKPASERPPFQRREGAASPFGSNRPQQPASEENANANASPSDTSPRPPFQRREGTASPFGSNRPQQPASEENANANASPSDTSPRPPFQRREGAASPFGSNRLQQPASEENANANTSPSDTSPRPPFQRREGTASPFGSNRPQQPTSEENVPADEAPARPTGAFSRPAPATPAARPNPFRRLEPVVEDDEDVEDIDDDDVNDVEYVDMDDVEVYDDDDEFAQNVPDEE